MISLSRILTLNLILFLVGLLGIVLNRRNVIIILISVELMLLAINLNLIVCSIYIDDMLGQVFALLVLTVAAAESAIGLAILVIFYRVRGDISMNSLTLLNN
jgi:NADH-quinone oxidoreductase subunit K